MTDIYLIMIFLFCAAAGYIAVSRGAGFLEQNLSRDSEMWYTVCEDSGLHKNTEAGNAFLWDGIFEWQMSAMETSPDFLERGMTGEISGREKISGKRVPVTAGKMTEDQNRRPGEESAWAPPRDRVSGRRRPGREAKGYKVRSGA